MLLTIHALNLLSPQTTSYIALKINMLKKVKQKLSRVNPCFCTIVIENASVICDAWNGVLLLHPLILKPHFPLFAIYFAAY
jgi:hypothetical protein